MELSSINRFTPNRFHDPTRPIQPDTSPLHNVKQPHSSVNDAHRTILLRRSPNFFQTRMCSQWQREQRSNKRPTSRRERFHVPNQKWWSRTGSNRRPEACKATALPTELRPLLVCLKRQQRHSAPCLSTQKCAAARRARSRVPFKPNNSEAVERPNGRRARLRVPKDKWWAWDDSNVRPHPYQGCALTT